MPDRWCRRTLGEVADIVGGFAFPHRSQGKSDGLYPFFKVSDMNRPGNEIALNTSANFVDEQDLKKLKARVYPTGTVVFPKVGAALLTNKRRVLGRPGLFDNNVMGLVPREIDGRFLLFFMGTVDFASMVQPGAVPSVNGTMVKALQLSVPPIGEQRRIAAILSSMDDDIAATQAVIDQLQVVKKALLAELLTRGLPGRHTRFKQTEIGEVPKEWEVVLLDSVARRGSGHTPDKKHQEYWNGSIKWVSLKDSYQLDRVYISDTEAKISQLGIENSSAVEHPPGVVVLSRDAGVGKSAITTDTMAVSQHFMAWLCGERLDNHYLYYRLQFMKPEFEHIAIGNTIKTIGLPYFKALRIPLPTIEEQRAMARVLMAHDTRTFAEEKNMAQLKDLKAALASRLLSGELRVTLPEAAA